jgi:hypothetical protein
MSIFQLLKLIAKGRRLTKPAALSQPLRDIVRSCYAQAPESRPTFVEIVQRLDAAPNFALNGTDWNAYCEYRVRLSKEHATGPRGKDVIDAVWSAFGWEKVQEV